MAILTCEKCGRLLNRASGECPVHGLVKGVEPEARELTPAEAMKEATRLMAPEPEVTAAAAPPAVAGESPETKHAPAVPPARMQLAATEEPPAPIAVSVPRGANASPPRPAPAPPPPGPPAAAGRKARRDKEKEAGAPPAHPGYLPVAAIPPSVARPPVGVVTGLRAKGQRVDLFAFQGALVAVRAERRKGHVAERGQLTPGQLVALNPANELFDGDHVIAIDVWERWPGGMVTVVLANDRRHYTWRGKGHHESDIETTLARAFLGRVDQAKPGFGPRARRYLLPAVVALTVVVGAIVGINLATAPEAPAPPPKAPPTTISAERQQLAATLGPVCPGWRTFAGAQIRGVPPDRAALKAAATPMVAVVNQAVSIDGSLSPAEQQAPYLLTWATEPVDVANREPVARLFQAIVLFTATCAKAEL